MNARARVAVNFWRPSGRGFGALAPGEPFLFELKAPFNAFGGFGFFERADVLPAWRAWDVFGLANGVGDKWALLDKIGVRPMAIDASALRGRRRAAAAGLSRRTSRAPGSSTVKASLTMATSCSLGAQWA